MNAGRELDALVATKVFGLRVVTAAESQVSIARHLDPTDRFVEVDVAGVFCGMKGIRHYSTDIAAAWQVVEKMRSSGHLSDINTRSEYVECEFWTGNHTDGVASSDTAPHAICLAALKALGRDAT
jgi:hypothetical protein